LILGIGLGLAPVGAYLAVAAQFALPPVLLGFIVLFWVSGFDIIYALQDEDFDKVNKLNSIPSYLGAKNALWVSRLLHFCAALLLMIFIYMVSGGWLGWVAYILFATGLFYQQLQVSPTDLSRVNLAFFTTNGVIAIVFGVLVMLDQIFF
jgi:4-hydroxybenzoate polyprenyltransferase